MYTHTNFKTKKALKEAVDEYNRALEDDPQSAAAFLAVTTFQPGPFGPQLGKTGVEYLEGPHYPAPHSWYAKVDLVNGVVVKVYK